MLSIFIKGYQRNHAYAKRLIGQYVSPEGAVHIFKSRSVWADIPEMLMGKEIAVYIERGNYDHYHVDLRFMISGN